VCVYVDDSSSVHRLAYEIAEKILKAHKAALKNIAETLIQKETLEQEEFYGLLKAYKLKPIKA